MTQNSKNKRRKNVQQIVKWHRKLIEHFLQILTLLRHQWQHFDN